MREDLIKPTFITATFGYGATIIGIGMMGVLALYSGISPANGDPNNLLPQLAATHLATPLIVVFFVMIIGSLSSTADSDLAALELNILDLLVFVGAMWGCLVFPVIASFYWTKVTNAAFTVSVLAFAAFLPVRFSLLPEWAALDLGIDLLGIVGAGIVLGLMAFGFFGPRAGIVIGTL